jgi:heme exporter protein B
VKQPSLWALAATVVVRELRLAFRRWGQVLHPLVFFAIVTTLFPLASGADVDLLRQMGPGVVWVAAMLASLLSLESLFRPDVEDGTMEQWVLSGQPLAWLLLFKTLAHWLLTGFPLVVAAPLMVAGFRIPNDAILTVVTSLALGTGVLSILGAVGAALTVSLRRGNVLVALLVLPLQAPILIFGAYAIDRAAHGESVAGPLYFLSALLLLALSLGPFGMASAIRISVES